ncbi:DUF418 domain-containing protein [Paenibacillus sp. GCM10027627]|uniref:DUF418 domain-containing protein n=1 Tax=unclassified Paenibacillus TaxID=185978 RepID=UPI003638C119
MTKQSTVAGRLDELDYLRGFALMGILLLNVIGLLHIPEPMPGTSDEVYQKALYMFGEARFFSIFSFLFGIGFYLFISRANAKGRNGYLLFLARVVLLFLMGLAHMIFHPGEALAVYAVCGLLLLPFYKVKRWINVLGGFLLLIAACVMGIKGIMPLSLIWLGIAAGQYEVMDWVKSRPRAFAWIAAASIPLAVIALIYQYSLAPDGPFSYFVLDGTGDAVFEQGNAFIKAGLLIAPVVTFSYMCVLLLLLRLKTFRVLLDPMRAMGRMALTNYVMQTVFVLAAGHLLDWTGTIGLWSTLPLCLAILAIQMTYSSLWLRYFTMGPLEWSWRALTYFKLPPFLKKGRASAET